MITDNTTDPFAASRMSLVEHLTELRKRLMYILGVMLVAMFVSFHFAPNLFTWLRLPLETAMAGQELQVLTPFEMPFTYVKISLLASVFITAPWILLQIWFFVAPGLYSHEKKWIAPFVIMGTLAFVAGGAAAFYYVIPFMYKTLATMVPMGVKQQFTVEEYFTTVFHLLLIFGFIFELPLVMMILAAAGLVKPQSFAKWRKYWVVGSFVVGGIVTADPSPVSMTMMAVPLVVFWEMGIWGSYLVARKREKSRIRRPEEL